MKREGLDDETGVGVEAEADGIDVKVCCRDADKGLGGIIFGDTTLVMMQEHRQGATTVGIDDYLI